jgi:diguanylate cyclase (GGDEF)-like protein/PAS domain S-box-containing protein
LTGNQDAALAIESLKNGAQDYLIKNQVDSDLLARSIRYAVERFQLFKKIEEERQRYELVATGSHDGLWDWDLVTNQIYYSPRWKIMFGYQDKEIASVPEEWLKRIHPEDIIRVTGELAEHLAKKSPFFVSEHRLNHKDGTYRWVLSRGIAVFTADNKPIRIAGSFTDITRHKELEQDLAQQAYYDPLTRMPNRQLFTENLKRAFAHLQRDSHYLFAVLFLDVDRFKYINDRFGHQAGDTLLAEFARRLKTCLRPSDFLARVGGDEFTVLAQDLAQAEDAERVAGKILASFALPFQLSTRDSMIAASLGISIFPDHGEDPITLLRHADLAMYSAKRAGGGTFRMFRSALSDSMEHRVMLERELKTALARNELTLEYQPLLDKNGRLDCVEALLRWNNPTAGRVSPAEFIPIAEETGLIPAIGEWVTRTACNDGARWLREGYDVPRIAVNVSPLQFIDGGFTALVQRTLDECGLPASRLEFEITETALMNNLENVIEQIEMLRRLGVRFAIDDFGTGYSSLSHLRNLPVDCVKIDRSFIKDLETGGDGCTTLVRGIIALAHSLRLQVVAEGVETAEQLALLKAL